MGGGCLPHPRERSRRQTRLPARRRLREEGLWYAGGLAPTDPRVSPLFGALEGLPSILLLTGTHDLLNRDANRLEKAMAALPGALQMSEYQNMIHVWPALPIPEAQMAMDEILAFLESPGVGK